MSVIQTNLWQCEICGKTETTKEEVFPYDSIVVCATKTSKWEYIMFEEKEYLACVDCIRDKG